MNVHRTWSHETELASLASSPSQARAFVSRHLRDHQMAHLVDDLRLVVSELATNAVVHARTPFTVTLGAFEQTLFLAVLDESRDGPTLVVAGALDTSGRGVSIVQVLSRDWGVVQLASGGKSVWAEFDVRSVGGPRSGGDR